MEKEPWSESLWGPGGPPVFREETEEEKRINEEKRIKEEEFKEEEEGPELAENSKIIEQKDIESAFVFLKTRYEEELRAGGEVTTEIVETNIAHAERVAENAKWIAKGERLDDAKLEFAGICHDCGKLNHNLPGGIDTFEHHTSSALTAASILQSKGKSPELVESIGNMIERHSFIPFIVVRNPEVPEPKTKEDFALRDADVLDQIDIWGLRKIIEIRQNTKSEFYKEDGGDFQKALASALLSRKNAIGLLTTPTAKKIADAYLKRSEKLLLKLKERNVKTLDEFHKTFDEFVKE